MEMFRRFNKWLVLLPAVALLLLLVAFKPLDYRLSKSLDIFFAFFRELSVFYVDRIDPERLVRVGIDAMLEHLDPYSELIPQEDVDLLEFQTTGEYGGMGAIIRSRDHRTIVMEVYEGSPAHRVGIRAGDVIVSVDGVSTANMPVNEVSEMLKGEPNTSLTVNIVRLNSSDTLVFVFSRSRIQVPSVPYHAMLGHGVGYIRLASFTSGSSQAAEKALRDLLPHAPRGIILDLRGNSGGLLGEAVSVVNLFVERGKLVVYTRGQIRQFDRDYRTESNPVNDSIPLLVLVDRGSASAAEIVAGALQDMDRAIIMGERTFGKGLVQSTRPLPYNYQLKITTAKYYIPSGRCIQAVDFSNRDQAVIDKPQPARQFTTRSGRPVFDGGGITPDTLVPPQFFSSITSALLGSNLIFDYATAFRQAHDSIPPPARFELSDKQFQRFMDYVKDKHNNQFNYISNTEAQLNELIMAAQQENFYRLAKSHLDALQEVVAANRLKDLEFSAQEIRTQLAGEIVGRFFFQRGQAEFQVRHDAIIPLAIGLLSDRELYASMLRPEALSQ